jgi:cysteinyl-tRNA synthetase
MDDDFNTGEALAVLFSLAGEVRKGAGAERTENALALRDLGRLVGMFECADARELLGPPSLHSGLGTATQTAGAGAMRGSLDPSPPGESGGQAKAAHAQRLEGTVDALMRLVLELRADARTRKDYAASDKIRDALAQLGIAVKDGKDGATWERS